MQNIDHDLPLIVVVFESGDIENLERWADLIYHWHHRGGTDAGTDVDTFDADDRFLRQCSLERLWLEPRE